MSYISHDSGIVRRRQWRESELLIWIGPPSTELLAQRRKSSLELEFLPVFVVVVDRKKEKKREELRLMPKNGQSHCEIVRKSAAAADESSNFAEIASLQFHRALFNVNHSSVVRYVFH